MTSAARGDNLAHYFWRFGAPLLFLLLWAAGFTVGKIGMHDAPPLTLLALRYACVLIVLVPPYFYFRPSWPTSWQVMANLCVVGLLIQVLYFGLAYVAIELGLSAGGVALIVSLQPIFVAVLAPAMIGEQVSWQRWIGLAVGLAGAVLVILAKSRVETISWPSVMCALGALAGMTVGTLFEKKTSAAHPPVHPIIANFVQCAVGLICTLPMAHYFEHMPVHWTGSLMFSLAYLVLCNSLIAISLLLAMIRRGEAASVSALFFLVPPLAALIARLALHEAMPTAAWLGMGLAAAGVALASSGSLRKAAPRPAERKLSA